MSRAPRARYAALLIMLPLLAGCSAAGGVHASGSAGPGSTPASSSSAPSAELQPCDDLSAADASAIVGAAVTSSDLNGACSYTGGDVAFATMVNRGITGAGDPVWKNEVKSLTDATKLSGVGDEAYGATSVVEEKIVVRAGDAVIEVADADGTDTTTYPTSIAVAKAIIAKLG
ncbi:MAG TPA: hypothetical protein VN759_05290 [Pseudolysinimonas sp.]|nr:hypothetical protein [Pseudolysinimonas sp.]